jgi:hypothetical protein
MAHRPILGMIVAGVAAQPAVAAQLGTASAPQVPWARIVLALLFCLALAAAAILVLQHHRGWLRFAPFGTRLPRMAHMPRRRIEVIETRRISPHGDVCLLHCQGQSYLVALGPGQALLLDRQPLTETGHEAEREP